ncbi:Zinc finger, RING-type [Dillenia turbinata]|uniref:RING-type E3 ubiquitin transferase n=1 Tax=Dillenia turbinata TaxID=194707 RepID=A0AAN8W4T8_9MAGN
MTYPRRFLGGANSTDATPTSPATATVNSDFVVILAALLCALICVLGLVAVVRCAWLRRFTGSPAAAGVGASQSPANKGLKKKVLKSLPKVTYAIDEEEGGKVSIDCAICLTEFVAGDEIRVLPQCGHKFHVGCIDTWLGSHSSCPSCRKILVVARCQKCGAIPATASSSGGCGGGGGTDTETRLKQREDDVVNSPWASPALNDTVTSAKHYLLSWIACEVLISLMAALLLEPPCCGLPRPYILSHVMNPMGVHIARARARARARGM